MITAAIATGAGDDEMLTYGDYAAVYAVEVDGDAVSASVSGDSVSVMKRVRLMQVTITGTTVTDAPPSRSGRS